MHYSVVVFASIVVSGCLGPSLINRSWRHFEGTPSRHMGLMSLEIKGCKKTAGQTDTSIMMGILKNGAYMLKNALCQGLTSETQNGVLSWDDYAEATCDEAASGKICMLAKLSPMSDPFGYCSSMTDRCGKLSSVKLVNQVTFGCLLLSMASSIVSSYFASRKKPRKPEAVGYALLAFTLVVMGLSVYYGVGNEYFSDEDVGVLAAPRERIGESLYLGIAGGAVCILQAVAAYLLRDLPQELRKGKASRKSKQCNEEGVALAEQGMVRGTYGAVKGPMLPTYAEAAAGDQTEAQMLQHVSAAIRARGCTELPQAYSGFDVNDDGAVTLEEFATGLRDLGVEHSPEQAQWLFRRMDTNMDGVISFVEFADHMDRFG